MASIKGSQVRAALELIGKKMGEEAVGILLEHLDESDRQLLTQPGLAVRWVSMDTYSRFLEAVVRIAYGGDERSLAAGAAKAVEGDLAGVYKAFTLISSPEDLMRRFATISTAYLDGVTVETRRVSATSYVITHRGFEPRHRIMERALMGWLEKMISVARGNQAKVTLLRSVREPGGEIVLGVEWESQTVVARSGAPRVGASRL